MYLNILTFITTLFERASWKEFALIGAIALALAIGYGYVKDASYQKAPQVFLIGSSTGTHLQSTR